MTTDSARSAAQLPPPRGGLPAAYSIAIVCLGNICRSPTAEAVLTRKLEEAGIREVTVTSAGTGTWHIGEQMDRRAASSLVARGYDPTRHRADLFTSDWFARHDLVLAMDGQNYDDVHALVSDEADHDRIMMFRAFDPYADGDLGVPDPFYGEQDGFDDVLAIVERTCDALVVALTAIPGVVAEDRQHRSG
jgi:protein-tyrosine phosphatase